MLNTLLIIVILVLSTFIVYQHIKNRRIKKKLNSYFKNAHVGLLVFNGNRVFGKYDFLHIFYRDSPDRFKIEDQNHIEHLYDVDGNSISILENAELTKMLQEITK